MSSIMFCLTNKNKFKFFSRFPRAGTANSKSNLKLVEFQLDEECQIINIKNMELQYPLAHMFPWMEYLVRVGWTPNDEL